MQAARAAARASRIRAMPQRARALSGNLCRCGTHVEILAAGAAHAARDGGCDADRQAGPGAHEACADRRLQREWVTT